MFGKEKCYVFEYENILNAVRRKCVRFRYRNHRNRLVLAIRHSDSVLRTDKGTCTPTWCVHPPTTTEVVTRIRDYDPENLFVCVFLFFFFFYLRTPPNAPRPRNLTEYAKLPNWIRL